MKNIQVTFNGMKQAMSRFASALGRKRRMFEINTDKTNIYDFIEKKKSKQPFYFTSIRIERVGINYMKAIDIRAKKKREDLELLKFHIEEHKDNIKHTILITYSNDEEVIVSGTGMAEIEYLGLLDFAKDFKEQFED